MHRLVHLTVSLFSIGVLTVSLMGCAVAQAPAPAEPLQLSTALHDAARRDDGPFIEIHVDHFPGGVDVRDSQQRTPLLVAAQYKSIAAADALVAKGADTSAHDADGYTPLHWAAKGRVPKMIQSFIAARADINATDASGATPLVLSIQEGNHDDAEVVVQLLNANADPNKADRFGWTAAHFAAKGAYLNILKALVAHHADVFAKTSDGLSPYDLAVQHQYTEVATYLKGLQTK